MKKIYGQGRSVHGLLIRAMAVKEDYHRGPLYQASNHVDKSLNFSSFWLMVYIVSKIKPFSLGCVKDSMK
jgi:hypothetical protein